MIAAIPSEASDPKDGILYEKEIEEDVREALKDDLYHIEWNSRGMFTVS